MNTLQCKTYFVSWKETGRCDPSPESLESKKIYSRQLLGDTDRCTQGCKIVEIKAHKHMIKQLTLGSVKPLWPGGFTCSDSLQVSHSSCRCHWSSPCALQGGFGKHCPTSKCIIGSQSVQTAAALTTSPSSQPPRVTGTVHTTVTGTQGKKGLSRISPAALRLQQLFFDSPKARKGDHH